MAPVTGFVARQGSSLVLEGQPYRVAGCNTYYLGYVAAAAQAGALDLAAAFGCNAIRIWAFFDAASPPAAGSVCFQYFDPVAKVARQQDGPDGLERLDRAVASAGERGIRLILTLTNNWTDFGGMPQIVGWFGIDPSQKNRFYADSRCRDAYRQWAQTLVTRRNSVTGRLYRDEPAILAWELANEPRCEGTDGVETLLAWVEDMSGFVKRLDSNHLVVVGDEGYFRRSRAGSNALFNGGYGVSTEELLGIGAVDFGTVHLYPETMGKDQDPIEFGKMWIGEHLDAAERASKPMLLEEYGCLGERRNEVFDAWLRLVEERNGLGNMLWMAGLPKSEDQPFQPDGYALSDPALVPAVGEHLRRLLEAGRWAATS